MKSPSKSESGAGRVKSKTTKAATTSAFKSSAFKERANQHVVTSNVERVALERSGYELLYGPEEKIPVVMVANFPALGKLAAIRFLEWVGENPEGVISLPTGKTPEHFIKNVEHSLTHWDDAATRRDLEEMGLQTDRRPDLSGLRFVQIDEFYPIDTTQHNSFHHYVSRFYLKGFGLDPARALLIDPNEIGIPKGRTLSEIFPGHQVDLSLRVRQGRNDLEKLQQQVLREVDEFCTDYEQRIRDMGGIGFFLGGIGPDGHIAFNVRGTDHYSTTRLTDANYETKAAAATDLGGIEVARDKHVITIGLATITYNRDAVAIIIAAGEAKAKIVSQSVESEPSNVYPASALAELKNGRFYLTRGAARRLKNRRYVDFVRAHELSDEDRNTIVMNLSLETQKPIRKLSRQDFERERFAAELLRKSGQSHTQLADAVEQTVLDNLKRGNTPIENKTFLHTAPHHDDIILAYLPYFTNLVRRSSTHHYFTYLTSGFTAVTNIYMEGVVQDLLERLSRGDFDEMLQQDYFDPDNVAARRFDTSHYLKGAASRHQEHKDEGVARRLLRNLIELYEDDNVDCLKERLKELHHYFQTQYPGKKDIPIVQQLKGRMREFESDLKWAYYGFTGEHVRHLRLGFYKGDIFTELPTMDRDIPPILNLMKEVNPDIVTVAFDPEGSGPDTHYKVLQAVSHALKIFEKESGRHDIKVLGYRNVWFKYHPAEANLYVPTSLRHLNDMEAAFDTCFTTQRTASFPSPEMDGPFSWLARKIQVKQFEQLKTFLGEDFFVQSEDHGLRATQAIVYLKEMTLEEFYSHSEALRSAAGEK